MADLLKRKNENSLQFNPKAENACFFFIWNAHTHTKWYDFFLYVVVNLYT